MTDSQLQSATNELNYWRQQCEERDAEIKRLRDALKDVRRWQDSQSIRNYIDLQLKGGDDD